MDRIPLRDRYSLAERQAVMHAFAMEAPMSKVTFVKRCQGFMRTSEACDLLRRLERDEVVMSGGGETLGDRLYAIVGSLLQPAPYAPHSKPPPLT